MPGCNHRGLSSEGSGGWYANYLCSTDVIIWFLYWSIESFDFSSWRQIAKHIDTHCIFVVRSSKDSSRLVWLFSSQLNSSIFVISLCFSVWFLSTSAKDRCKDDFQTGWPTCSMQAMALDRAPRLSFTPLREEQRLIPNFQLSLKTTEVCWINPKDESTLFPPLHFLHFVLTVSDDGYPVERPLLPTHRKLFIIGWGIDTTTYHSSHFHRMCLLCSIRWMTPTFPHSYF